MSQERGQVLLNGVADIALRFLNSLAVAEAAGQGRTVSRVALIAGFFLYQDFKGVELHASALIATAL